MKRIIDISEHNKVLSFKKLSKDVDGIILRLGWIGNKNNHTLDKKFKKYYKKCKKYNIKIGCYIYSYTSSVGKQKNANEWIKKQLKGLSFDYPIFIDLEDKTINKLSKIELTNMAIKFCKDLKEYDTGIYANTYWFTSKLLINKLEKYKIWLAEWSNKKEPSVSFKVDLWQFTNKAKINGILGHVDCSYCMCDCIENKKTPLEIAREVIQGKWGNGLSRKLKLKKAGYNYSQIQKIVNGLLKR